MLQSESRRRETADSAHDVAYACEDDLAADCRDFVYGPTSGIVGEMGGWPESELVFVINSQIPVTDDDFGLTVDPFPGLEELVDLGQNIDLDTDVQAEMDASDLL